MYSLLITAQEVAGLNPVEVTIIIRDCSNVVLFLFPHLHTICTQVLSKNNKDCNQLQNLNSYCNVYVLEEN